MANGKGSEDCLLCRFVNTSDGAKCMKHGLLLPRPGYEVVCIDFESGADGKRLQGTTFVGLRDGALYYYSYAVSSHCDVLVEFEDLSGFALCNAALKGDLQVPNSWKIEFRNDGFGMELLFDFDGRFSRGVVVDDELTQDMGPRIEGKASYALDDCTVVSDWLNANYSLALVQAAFADNKRLAARGIPLFVRVSVGEPRPNVAKVAKDTLAARILFDT